MSSAELKMDLFRKLDALEGSRLKEVYGILINFINSENNDWDELSEAQKNGILKGIQELDAGKGIPHEDVIRKYKSKFSDD
jgi:predicted transcriptional regulator